MAYKLPADIESELQKRFPEVHVPTIVDAIFQSIIGKITRHSNCTVREFGKFTAFVTHSEKLSKDTVRFKFKISSALNKKIKSDQYLLENLPAKAQVVFDERNQQVCEDKQLKKMANLEAISEANKISRKKTDEAVAADTISKIIRG
jgi:nucleoid DNA-binding protein